MAKTVVFKDDRIAKISLNVPLELKKYVYAAAYRESTPEKMVSMTEYLCNLIRKDMSERNGK